MIVSSPASVDATLPETGPSRMPAPRARTAGATARIVSGRTVLMSTATEPAPEAGRDPVRAVEQVVHGGVVGDHRDDDVRPRRGLGRGGRHARADPARPARSPGPASGCRPRPRRPARPAARPSPSPSGPCRGRLRSGRSSTAAVPALTRRRPSGAGRSRRCARPTARRGPRARPPTAAGCAVW